MSVTDHGYSPSANERLQQKDARISELEAEVKRWQFIGTHDYSLRRPKHLGGGPGVVIRGGWELDGLADEYERVAK